MIVFVLASAFTVSETGSIFWKRQRGMPKGLRGRNEILYVGKDTRKGNTIGGHDKSDLKNCFYGRLYKKE